MGHLCGESKQDTSAEPYPFDEVGGANQTDINYEGTE